MARDQPAERAGNSDEPEDLKPASAETNVERELRAIFLMGRRNLDTVFEINRLTADCILRCAMHQSEGCEKLSTNAFKIVSELGAQVDGSKSTISDRPMISDMLEVTMTHLRELSEVITRANREALDLVSSRTEECFTEIEEFATRNIGTLMAINMHLPMLRERAAMQSKNNRDR